MSSFKRRSKTVQQSQMSIVLIFKIVSKTSASAK